jgi:predicted DNA-binding transcriptional regulator AlpA
MNNLSLATVKGDSQSKHAAQRKTAIAAAIPSFDDLPDSAFIRQAQLVQNAKRPGVPAPLPFSPGTLWRKVRNGQFPQPVKLSPGMTAWRVADVRRWIESQTGTAKTISKTADAKGGANDRHCIDRAQGRAARGFAPAGPRVEEPAQERH